VPISDPVAPGPARGLPAHAAYACRESGVCCSSDWEIPVEAALHARLAPALADGRLAIVRGDGGLVWRNGLPEGVASVLGRAGGRCVFHGTGPAACRLHAWGGETAKPIACRQFPWIAVHDPRGTFVSLSHVCPTAAALLHAAAPLAIRPLRREALAFEGLDVRRALPPALDGRRLADWDAVSAWEAQALDACARARQPEDVVGDLAALLAHARRWSAADGPLARWIASWTPGPAGPAWAPDPALDAIVRAAVPAALHVPPPVPPRRGAAWSLGGTLIGRYLAARLVACWPMHHGEGLGTVVTYVAALLSVIAIELSRRAGTGNDDEMVIGAVAETDRLAVHLAAPDLLAAGLDTWTTSAARRL
jgi:Fe-S-cluster containining protein